MARLRSGTEVDVNWTAKYATDDDVIGYDIERRTNQIGDWAPINESVVEVRGSFGNIKPFSYGFK